MLYNHSHPHFITRKNKLMAEGEKEIDWIRSKDVQNQKFPALSCRGSFVTSSPRDQFMGLWDLLTRRRWPAGETPTSSSQMCCPAPPRGWARSLHAEGTRTPPSFLLWPEVSYCEVAKISCLGFFLSSECCSALTVWVWAHGVSSLSQSWNI